MNERISSHGYTYDKQVRERVHAGPHLVHEALSVREDGAELCTCGLLVAQGIDLLEAQGHLDAVTKRPAATYVVRAPRQGSYLVRCRDCTWRQVRPTLQLATASRRSHRCPAAPRPVMRLRTRADMLAGALELIGWSVADDDPRAEAFLDRFIELGRAQKDGRISRDGAHETLRREFPLR